MEGANLGVEVWEGMGRGGGGGEGGKSGKERENLGVFAVVQLRRK